MFSGLDMISHRVVLLVAGAAQHPQVFWLNVVEFAVPDMMNVEFLFLSTRRTLTIWSEVRQHGGS